MKRTAHGLMYPDGGDCSAVATVTASSEILSLAGLNQADFG